MTDHPNTFAVLRFLVERAKCKPNWRFKLTAVAPMELLIKVTGPDSRNEFPEDWTIAHHFPVPYATYNEKTWRRWIFECCRKVEDHELMEWFRIDDERPFAPLHGPGEDPYTIHEFRDTVDAYMNQDGTVRGSEKEPECSEVEKRGTHWPLDPGAECIGCGVIIPGSLARKSIPQLEGEK